MSPAEDTAAMLFVLFLVAMTIAPIFVSIF